MKRRLHLLALAVAALPMLACSSGTVQGTGDRYLITAEEIANVNVGNAFEAVERLRPQWFREQNQRSISGGGPGEPDIGTQGLVTYIDGIRAGGPDALRSIPASTVVEMRFLDPSRATAEYGTGHLFGAIQVLTRAGVRR